MMQHRDSAQPKDIQIFIPCREDDYVPSLPFVVPVQIGSSRSQEKFVDFEQDDAGENISAQVALYKELTAQYWAWKNSSADYCGFMQNRQYLEFCASEKNADEYGVVAYGMLSAPCFDELGYQEEQMRSLIEQNDIIVCQKYEVPDAGVGLKNICSWYDSDWRKNGEDFDRLLALVKALYPEYVQDVESYLLKETVLPFNLFVMKRVLFNDYAEFLFNCLFSFSKSIDERSMAPYAVQAPSYLSTHLLGIFIEHCIRTYSETRVRYVRSGSFRSSDDPYLRPAFEDNNCPVVFSSSDYYSLFAGVAIQSIVENSSPQMNYDIIILDTGMRDASRMLLRRQLREKKNFSLRFLSIEHELNSRNLPSAHHITIGTFGRFLILDHLIGYNKVVYLDCDLVVNADIADLYSTDLGACLLAAVRDTAGNGWYNIPGNEMHDHINDVLEITEPSGYFNAGVLVLNLAAFRQEVTCDDLMQMAVDPKWLWLDQDVLNHFCRGRVKYIDQAWNYMAHKESYLSPGSLPEVWLPGWLQDDYAKAQTNPFIVHYVGHSIPCFASEADCYWYFWQYARKSLFYERILKIAMSEVVENEQMSTRVHARQAIRGIKEVVKKRLNKHS